MIYPPPSPAPRWVASLLTLATLAPLFLAAAETGTTTPEAYRSRAGLLALYSFDEREGADINDSAQAGAPLDLSVPDVTAIRRSQGSLELTHSTTIASKQSAARVSHAVKRTGEFTLEAWIHTDDLKQSGPARIFTLSKDSSERNVTLGQDGDRFEVRFRTSKTSENGTPALSSPPGSVTTDLTQVVYTRSRGGLARLYLNGQQVAERELAGGPNNWSSAFHLGLGNELSGDRPWEGTYHLIALYNRDLVPSEVERHFHLGPDAPTEPAAPEQTLDPNAQLFEESIAPILARHCLECHDPANRKGKLDLSRRQTTLAGGSEGPAIVPGDPDASLLWELVHFDDMPADREPLSPEEKVQLKTWIAGGALWSGETIDPLAHKRDRRAQQNWVRRLTLPEYVATVQAAVGVDIAEDAARLLPPDLRADGFSNTAYNLNVGFKHVEAYAELAALIVDRMDLQAFTDQFSRNLKFTDPDMGAFIEKAGKWLLRGPLEDHEVIAYRGISTTVAGAGGSKTEAVRYIVEAMLQSPRFIYLVENQQGDGKTWPVNEYELASRLSYMIWGASPDRALIDAADNGELYDPALVGQQVDRMLEDPRALAQSLRFFSEWLHLERLENLRPNPEKFPHWDPALAGDMKQETLAVFRDLAWEQNRPLAELLNAPFTYVTPRLARHYNLQAALPAPDQDETLQRVSLENDPTRGGILTHGSILTVGGDEASMVTRGLFVLHDLLRSGVNDPPPGVDTNPVPTEPGLTQRAIAEKRVADRSCGGCHSKFEPLAYGLEKFDGLGTYRDLDEHKNTLREDGEILFPGEADPIPYARAAELMDLLAGSERVVENFTWKIAQFALGRPLVPADTPTLQSVHKLAMKDGGTYKSLLKALALSDLVRTTRTEPMSKS